MKVSIITVNYNNSEGLKKTLESVINQSSLDYELIIIDGASTDNSIDIIKGYALKIQSLSYISEKDKGIYNAMNKGINMSNGEYLIFMNSGDCFYNEQSLENTEPFLDAKHDIISGIAISERYKMYPVKPENLSMSFFLKSSMNHQATFIKRELMLKYHYSEKYRIISDTEFFFKAMILDNCSYLDIPVYVCLCEDAGASGDLKASLNERYFAIKSLIPTRMSNDVDFIIKYDNPIIRKIGNMFYNKFFRCLYDKLIRRGGRT